MDYDLTDDGLRIPRLDPVDVERVRPFRLRDSGQKYWPTPAHMARELGIDPRVCVDVAMARDRAFPTEDHVMQGRDGALAHVDVDVAPGGVLGVHPTLGFCEARRHPLAPPPRAPDHRQLEQDGGEWVPMWTVSYLPAGQAIASRIRRKVDALRLAAMMASWPCWYPLNRPEAGRRIRLAIPGDWFTRDQGAPFARYWLARPIGAWEPGLAQEPADDPMRSLSGVDPEDDAFEEWKHHLWHEGLDFEPWLVHPTWSRGVELLSLDDENPHRP